MNPMKMIPILAVVGLAACSSTPATSQFTPEEARAVVNFWAEPSRYQTAYLAPPANGPWQIRMSAEGSEWLHAHLQTRQSGKILPTANPQAQNAEQVKWDAWIDRRYEWDRYHASLEAHANNERFLGKKLAAPNVRRPAEPGQMPPELKKLSGVPPSFFKPVVPRQHIIAFDDGTVIKLNDNATMRDKYPYFRFHEGVMSSGEVRFGAEEINTLMRDAGISQFEGNVLRAVSRLEGGFDSLNTYDTGLVSVGFIQFACLRSGSGSLGRVMLTMKRDYPDAFQSHFRRFGLCVDDNGVIIALNTANGTQLAGPQAADRIIRDKRLAAVYKRAGQKSREFCMAQFKTAMAMYYPGHMPIQVNVGGRTHSLKVSDVIVTEAGMATLMDRKVNTGNLGDLEARISEMAAFYGIQRVEDLPMMEYLLVRAMRYREDFLAHATLAKPRDTGLAAARGGNSGRGN